MLLIVTAFLPVVGTINVGKTKIQEGTAENVGLAPASTLCQEDGNEADEGSQV